MDSMIQLFKSRLLGRLTVFMVDPEAVEFVLSSSSKS